MKVLKHPVILILVFLALGILFDYHQAPSLDAIVPLALIAAAAFVFSFFYSQRSFLQKPYFLLATCFLSLNAGMLSHWLHYAPNSSLHYTHLIDNTNNPVIRGVISERLKPTEYYEKYYFKIESINKAPSSGQLLLSVQKDSLQKRMHAGDVLIIADTPQPIYKSLNPYQFNYSEYMAKQNVFHQITLRDNYIMAGQVKNFDYYLEKLRNSLINSFEIHNFPDHIKNIINALLLGQRQDMDKQTTQDYTNAGVIHILAISGLHFATLFYILNLLLSPLRRINRKGLFWQLIIVLSVLWLFAFITGLSASVVRSVVMFSFVGIGRYLNRNSNIFNSIAVSMLILLLAKPNFLFDVGFQLSYTAVFAIVWLQPLYSRLRTSKYKTVNYISDTVLICLVAQLGVLPLSLYYFNQFPLLFLIANIVVIPLSTVILLTGLAVLVLNFIMPSIAVILGKGLSVMIIIMNRFIEWIASFENLVLKDIPFTLLLNIALYIVIIFIVRWFYKKSFHRTVVVIVSVMIFQLLYTATSWNSKKGNEMIIFNNKKHTLLAVKKQERITVYSADSLSVQNTAIKSYNKENFNLPVLNMPLKNIVWFKNKKILVIDSLGIYPANAKPDILLLTQSTKINLDRALMQLKPKQVVADATNFKNHIKIWEASCREAGISFHSTTQKGFYKIN